MKREVIRTADGSSTIRIESMEENYHSGHGALQEARHVFIKNGLDFLREYKKICVFEMGFGTGLNALLAAEFALKHGIRVEYTGVEAYPVEKELISQLNYTEKLDSLSDIYNQMHSVCWGKQHMLDPLFEFHKIHSRIEDWEGSWDQFDIVFFDAFGPRAQGELWEVEILRKMYQLLISGGIFVTYCAQGQFKRNMRSVGFEVQSLPGPPGKREMTKGIKFFLQTINK